MENLKEWWSLGRNSRVPGEDGASWIALIRDDLNQLAHSDSAFKAGTTSFWSLRPLYAFHPRMIKTGPTPLVRQLVERPFRGLLALTFS